MFLIKPYTHVMIILALHWWHPHRHGSCLVFIQTDEISMIFWRVWLVTLKGLVQVERLCLDKVKLRQYLLQTHKSQHQSLMSWLWYVHYCFSLLKICCYFFHVTTYLLKVQRVTGYDLSFYKSINLNWRLSQINYLNKQEHLERVVVEWLRRPKTASRYQYLEFETSGLS